MQARLPKSSGQPPVITTAADVNRTIAVDMVGREFGWEIEDHEPVTRVSALMVNEEKIGVYQDCGQKNWWKGGMPKNVTVYSSMRELSGDAPKAVLAISDRILDVDRNVTVIYRPKTLVVGVGLHQDTTRETIQRGLDSCLKKFSLSPKSIAKIVSIKKPHDIKGLADFAECMGIPLEYIERKELEKVKAPNPSEVVKSFEGTASVSEAASILASGGSLVVEKQKFPPDLTIAVSRMSF